MGHIDRGAGLFDALRDICRQHEVRCAELRASGSLESVGLASFDQSRRDFGPTRELSGNLELVSLYGTVSEHDGELPLTAHATLARDRDSGMEVVGGRVRNATVFSVEYVIETMDDVLLRRAADRDTGLVSWVEALTDTATPIPTDIASPPPMAPIPDPPKPTPTPTPAATATPTPSAPTSSPDYSEIHPGDIMVHPKFGRCTVMRIEGDQEFVHVRLRNGRIVRLSLEILTLQPQGTEDGQRIFEASID